MASTYSSNLAIELLATGEQSGTWGITTNTNLGTLIEQAISGYATQAITDGSDTSITIPNGASGVARNMFIELTGTLTAGRNLIVPTNKKLYFIYNNTSGGYPVTVKVSGQTGITVANGQKRLLVCNGTDVVEAVSYTIATAGALAESEGGTGETTYSAGQLLIGNSSGGLTKTTLTAGSNVTITEGDGSIEIAASSSGGSVTNVAMSTTLSGISVAGSPITGTGEFELSGTLGVSSGGTGVSDSTGSGTKVVLHTAPTIANPTLERVTVSGNAHTPPVAVTFSATAMTLNCQLSNVFTTTFTASVTTAPTISNPQDGQTINWFITQDGTGSRTMTWPTSFKWPGGTAGTLSTGAADVDLLVATYRAATGFWYATLLTDFS